MALHEPVIIVPQSAITRGKRLRYLWFSGWALAMMSIIGSAFLGGQVVAYRDSAKELEHERSEIKALQAQYADLAKQFAVAWEDQRLGINLVTSWAAYVKDRDDISVVNRKNGTDITRSVASKGK